MVAFQLTEQSHRAALHFVHVSIGRAHFQNDEIRIPWMPMRPSMLLSVVECLKS